MTSFEQVKSSLFNILMVLESLGPMQRETLIRFEQCEFDPLTQNLQKVINNASEKEMETLICTSQYQNGKNDNEFMKSLSDSQISAFGCIFRLLLLQETFFQWFSWESFVTFTQICNMTSEFTTEVHFQILHHFQQLLSQLLPEMLENMYIRVHESTDRESTANQLVGEFLHTKQLHSLLHLPLTRLLLADLEVINFFHDTFPKLQPTQVLQIVRLMELENQLDVLEIRELLSPDQKGWKGLQNSFDINMLLDHEMNEEKDEEVERFSLTIIDQPPEKTVYKRCLKPNPTVIVHSEHKPNLHPGESLCVIPSLYRFDTNQPVLFLDGNPPTTTTVGSRVTFKRLKVTKTSKQLDDTLFYLRFELRKTDGHKQSESLASVSSKPFFVVSHSSLLTSEKVCKAKISEIVPSHGTTEGGSRIAILGSDFEDSPSLVVRFDNVIIVPEYHGPGTLVCVSPFHSAGDVTVMVSCNGKDYSTTTKMFTFKDSPNTTTTFDISDFQAMDVNNPENMDVFDSAFLDELINSGFHPIGLTPY